MTEQKKPIMTPEECRAVSEKAMENALLSFFRRFDELDKARLLMKAECLAEAARALSDEFRMTA